MAIAPYTMNIVIIPMDTTVKNISSDDESMIVYMLSRMHYNFLLLTPRLIPPFDIRVVLRIFIWNRWLLVVLFLNGEGDD